MPGILSFEKMLLLVGSLWAQLSPDSEALSAVYLRPAVSLQVLCAAPHHQHQHRRPPF